jgi:ketosteroid isomerase-like protein
VDGTRLQAMFAAIDAEQWDALPRFFHPEVIYERPGFPELRGLDRLLLFYRHQRPIAHGVHTVEGIAVQDGRGAAWGRVDCVMTDGTRTGVGFADVYLFERGVIRLRRTHFFVPAV